VSELHLVFDTHWTRPAAERSCPAAGSRGQGTEAR
jgi:hypothetical protein